MKKVLSLMCCLLLSLSLCTGCNSSDSSDDESSASSSEAESAVNDDSSSSNASSDSGESSSESSDSDTESKNDSDSDSDTSSDESKDSTDSSTDSSDSGSDTDADTGDTSKDDSSNSDSSGNDKKDDKPGSSEKKPDSSKPSGKKTGKKVSNDKVDIKEYLFKDSIGGCRYYLIVTNNSDDAISFKADGTAVNKNGENTDAATMTIDVIGSHETSIGNFFFGDAKDVEKVKYDYSCETETTYKSVINNLSVEQNNNDKNVTLVVTNKADIPAQFVQAYAIFFDKNNKIINSQSKFITDGDSEIKPGASVSAQLDCYEKYDHVEIYYSGRSSGISLSKDKTTSSSDKDFAIKEYKYENNFGTYYYLVYTNNSKETVSISANATAKDKQGNVVGCADMIISVLAPGETSIGSLSFYDVKGVEKVEYQTSYKEQTSIYPVIKELSVEYTKNKDNIAVTIENKGKNPAEMVQAYAVLFDKNNKVLAVESKFITDSDFEIKPGKKESNKIKTYKEYDHVEIYLTGKYLNINY
ncbi:MAG: hypothetical protein K6F91_06595 [Ruminococcus sp.]|nr:hypothetical protein [Ruminococcus sp.]